MKTSTSILTARLVFLRQRTRESLFTITARRCMYVFLWGSTGSACNFLMAADMPPRDRQTDPGSCTQCQRNVLTSSCAVGLYDKLPEHWRVRVSFTITVGRFGRWLNDNPLMISPLLNYVVQGLGMPKIGTAAAEVRPLFVRRLCFHKRFQARTYKYNMHTCARTKPTENTVHALAHARTHDLFTLCFCDVLPFSSIFLHCSLYSLLFKIFEHFQSWGRGLTA